MEFPVYPRLNWGCDWTPSNCARGQVQWSVETTKGFVDSVKTAAHGKLQETLTSIKGTYVTR